MKGKDTRASSGSDSAPFRQVPVPRKSRAARRLDVDAPHSDAETEEVTAVTVEAPVHVARATIEGSGRPSEEATEQFDPGERPVPLSPRSPPSARPSWLLGVDNPEHPTPVGLHYGWHRCAVDGIALDEVLHLGPPASDRAEIRRLQAVLGAGDELAFQRFQEYMAGAHVWVAPPDMPGDVHFVFSPWEVQYYDQAAYLLFQRSSDATDFASPVTAIAEFSRFPRENYSTRLELTAGNARRRFGRVFAGMDYQLLRAPAGDPVRVAPSASLHEKVALGALSEVPQVMKDLEVPHGLPVAAPLAVTYFGLTPGVNQGNVGVLWQSMLALEWLFNIAEAFLHEAVFSQRAWLLPATTAEAAELHWPRFPRKVLADGVATALPQRLLSGEGLVALMQRVINEPRDRLVPRVSLTTGVRNLYACYDSGSDSFFEDASTRRKESRLMSRGRGEGPLAEPVQRGESRGYFGGFGASPSQATHERRSQGNQLRVRLSPQSLRGVPRIDVLYEEADLKRYYSAGEVLSHACYTAYRLREDSRRNAEELARARRELARMEADLHSSQVRASALEARVQALETARAFQPLHTPSLGYGPQYGYMPMQVMPEVRTGKRVRDAMYDEPSMAVAPQAPMPSVVTAAPAYQAPRQTSYVTASASADPYAPSRQAAAYGSTRADPYSYSAPRRDTAREEVVASGGDPPREREVGDPYPPVRRYPSYSAPPLEPVSAGAQQEGRVSTTAQPLAPALAAPMRAYQPGYRDPYAEPRGFPPPNNPFTGGSTSGDWSAGPRQG